MYASTLKTNQCSVYINHHTHSITFPYTRNGSVDEDPEDTIWNITKYSPDVDEEEDW